MLSSIFASAAFLVSSALAASLQEITVSPNPNNVPIYVYIPAALAIPPPLIVAAHYCGGSAQAYYTGTTYAQLADTHGYIVIYPTAPLGCWDVATNATLTHDAGGDSLSIASAVRYAIANYGVDPNRVFVTGTSSGAMFTNVLLGAYPDLFQGGSAFSGVPYACFEGPSAWNTECALGEVIKTPQEWGDLVRSGYPGYTGPRPKMQVWHGTVDTTLYPQNFWEEIKQWTNVFGYTQTPVTNITNQPFAGYSNATYGPLFQAILAQNVGHTVPEDEAAVLQFFGLDTLTPGPVPSTTVTSVPHTTLTTASTTKTSPTTTVTHLTPPPTTTAAGQSKYGQCGGIGWTGPTTCIGSTCTYSNAYYSQCL